MRAENNIKGKPECKEQTNLENLVSFIEKEGPELQSTFLALLEMCFHGEEHGF